MRELTGKTAFVTGGGIGLALGRASALSCRICAGMAKAAI
jgi:hypothetical protein